MRQGWIGILTMALCACGSSSTANNASTDAGTTTDATSDVAETMDVSTDTTLDGYPAFHPARPQLQVVGPIIASPKFVPVFFPDDSDSEAVDGQLAAYLASPHWKDATAEYGVGAATKAPRVTLSKSSPSTFDLSSANTWMSNEFASEPDLSPGDASTIFVFAFPSSTIFRVGTTPACPLIHGLHSVTISSQPSFILLWHCPTFAVTQDLTSMLVSTATEGLYGFDAEHSAYSGIGPDFSPYAEVGTSCGWKAVDTPDDLGFVVQRTWSNARSAAYHDPCLPAPNAPYFTSVPVSLGEIVTDGGPTLHGVVLGADGSGDFDLDLISDAPTSGPWSVALVAPRTTSLTFTLSATSGTNGDVIHVHVTGGIAGDHGTIEIDSKLGDRVVREYVPVRM